MGSYGTTRTSSRGPQNPWRENFEFRLLNCRLISACFEKSCSVLKYFFQDKLLLTIRYLLKVWGPFEYDAFVSKDSCSILENQSHVSEFFVKQELLQNHQRFIHFQGETFNFIFFLYFKLISNICGQKWWILFLYRRLFPIYSIIIFIQFKSYQNWCDNQWDISLSDNLNFKKMNNIIWWEIVKMSRNDSESLSEIISRFIPHKHESYLIGFDSPRFDRERHRENLKNETASRYYVIIQTW